MKLFEFERAWAAAAFDAVFPEGTALPHGIARMNPAAHFDAVLASAPLESSIGLRLTLWLVALAPLWVLRRPRTIASLTPEEQRTVLERLLASPVYAIRQLALGFKAVGSMLYAQSAVVRAAITTPHPSPAEPLVALRRTQRDGGAQERTHEHAAE